MYSYTQSVHWNNILWSWYENYTNRECLNKALSMFLLCPPICVHYSEFRASHENSHEAEQFIYNSPTVYQFSGASATSVN